MKDFEQSYLFFRRKNRNFFEMIASMLEIARKTSVSGFLFVKVLGTNSKQIKKYLELLVKRGLVEINYKNGRILYKTSEKGIIFLRHYNILREILFGELNKTIMVTESALQLKRKGARAKCL